MDIKHSYLGRWLSFEAYCSSSNGEMYDMVGTRGSPEPAARMPLCTLCSHHLIDHQRRCGGCGNARFKADASSVGSLLPIRVSKTCSCSREHSLALLPRRQLNMGRIRGLKYLCWSFVLLTVTFFVYLTRPDEPRLFLTRLNQISLGVEQRVTWWDWEDTEEEKWCHNPSKGPKERIPHVVHYIFLGRDEKPAEMAYRAFLSVKAALIRLRPARVKIHTTGIDPSNQWWIQLRDHVGVVTYNRSELRGPHGRPFSEFWVPHQADFLRLAILEREGGIYFDSDVFALKPFDDLLDSPRDVVMGHEGGNRYGFGNAVILARPHSEFITRWIASYESFNSWIWNYHSIRMPKLLQVQYPDLICPLSPSAFFWPTWAAKHHRYMESPIDEEEAAELKANLALYDGAMYENQLALHQGVSLTPDAVLHEDTRFNLLVRDLVEAPFP